MLVTKRDKSKEEFDLNKIITAVGNAFKATEGWNDIPENLKHELEKKEWPDTVEKIQNEVEELLNTWGFFKVCRNFIVYREKHAENRLITDKVAYILNYCASNENAATSSNTDANANNSIKNVSSLEPEVFKDKNRLIQRKLMKDMLNKLYPEVAKQYEEDLKHHIIYTHDEASSPVPKNYCGAYSLYPLITEGVGNIDNVTPTPPNDLQSFSGQVTNLVFALSAQTKGAVALSDYFVTFNYYTVAEFGPQWYDKLNIATTSPYCKQQSTVKRDIRKAMKQFIYGINQPQGNRGYQSPFTNISFFDKYYFASLFEGYTYPDGTSPEWKAIDTLQRIFVELLRDVRLVKPCTFPVTTFALLYDENGEYKDQEYAELCAEEWAKGSSHFLYQSSNPDSISSCCRVQNKLQENYFSSTTGMIGVMTGSSNVITLNLNRIIQDWDRCYKKFSSSTVEDRELNYESLENFIKIILDRVYKYHVAYKTMIYQLEEQGMITYSTANYLYTKKLYSTIGVIGYYEAARYLNLAQDSDKYREFLANILGTISRYNKENSIHDKKHPFIFNLEAIPGENLAVKLYNWDKKDGYWVPEDQNLYNCYFFNPWNHSANAIDKIKAHGGEVSKASDGGYRLAS